ncbi:hypothetical protein MXB_1925 [Myxobolus squamalis]|nr:hypothetical protein MXB_1925 [Myxobolus squamalis]
MYCHAYTALMSIIESVEWKNLADHYSELKGNFSLKKEFAKDEGRHAKYSKKFTIGDEFIFVDFSKNVLNKTTLDLLIALAKSRNVKENITSMFNGECLNFTEKRPVLHVALRNTSGNPIFVENCDVMPEVNRVLTKIATFVDGVLSGKITGLLLLHQS